MSRWLPTAALLAALALTVTGCGSSPTTGGGKAGSPTGAAPGTGKASDAGKDTGKGGGHDPG